MASTSSGPSVSSVILAPLPAASIITPMMLLALIFRPLRPIETSLWYLAASCVSLAAARACSPSLLITSTSRCNIDRGSFEMQHAVAAAADRLLDHRFHAFAAVSESPHKHRQAYPGHGFDSTRAQELGGEVGRRGAVDVREDQHAVAGVEALDQFARLGQQVERVVACLDPQSLELRRPGAENMGNRASKAVAQGVVSDDEDPDHGLLQPRGVSSNAPRKASSIMVARVPCAPASSRKRCRSGSRTGAFERLDKAAADVEPRLLRDLHEAGWARHVDFGQVVADDIETDDQQPFRPELRAQRL